MASIYEDEILGAQQQRDLARKLRDTEVPSTGHMIGDWYVAPTVAQQLSAVLKQGIGAYKENQAEDEIKGLKQERARSSADAFSQMGMQAPSGLLAEAGSPAIKPSIMDRLGAALTFNAQPKGTPAQPYQQTIAQNVTAPQSDAAMLSLMSSNPELGAGAIGLSNTRATREATAEKEKYERNRNAATDAEKVREFQIRAIETERANKASEDLRQAVISSRQPPQVEMPVAIMGPNNQPLYVTREQSFGKVPFNALTTVSPQQQQKMNVDAGEEANTASALFSKVNEIQKASQELKTSPGLPGISGYRGVLPNLPESEASLAQNKYDSLMGKITSLGKDVAASSGAVGNMAVQEWGILRDTIAKIDPVKLGTKKTIEALDEVDASLNRLGSRTQQAYERTYQPVIEQDPKRFGLKFQPYQPQTTKVNDVQSEADAILGRK